MDRKARRAAFQASWGVSQERNHDGSDLSDWVMFELRWRRMPKVLGSAVAHPCRPKFDGLSLHVSSRSDESGAAVTMQRGAFIGEDMRFRGGSGDDISSMFDERAAAEQKTKATILKSTRLFNEERDAEQKRQTDTAACSKGGKK